MLSISPARSLDPFTANYEAITEGSHLAALYDGLLWINPATGTVEPQLAESMTPSADNRVWTMRIRPDIRFSDGTPFDADAVAANWRMHADPAVRSLRQTATVGVRWKVDGPLALTITLEKPNANFDKTIAGRLNYIASPTALRDRNAFAAKPIGAGPYLFAERTPGGEEVYIRNPEYWQPDRPYADRLVFKVVTDPIKIAAMIADGDGDLTISTTPQVIATARDKGLTVEQAVLSGGQMLIFNTARAPFDDVRLRTALVQALDAQRLNEVAFDGAGIPARSVFSSWTPIANPQLSTPLPDPDAAAREFAALAAKVPGGKLTVNVLMLELTTIRAVGEYVRSALSAFPQIDCRVETLPVPEFAARTQVRRDFDVAMWQMWLDDPEPGLYQFLHSDSPGNITGYASAEADAALEAGRVGGTQAERRIAYTRLQLALNKDLPVWTYQESVTAAVATRRLSDVAIRNDGIPRFDRLGRND